MMNPPSPSSCWGPQLDWGEGADRNLTGTKAAAPRVTPRGPANYCHRGHIKATPCAVSLSPWLCSQGQRCHSLPHHPHCYGS